MAEGKQKKPRGEKDLAPRAWPLGFSFPHASSFWTHKCMGPWGPMLFSNGRSKGSKIFFVSLSIILFLNNLGDNFIRQRQ